MAELERGFIVKIMLREGKFMDIFNLGFDFCELVMDITKGCLVPGLKSSLSCFEFVRNCLERGSR